MECGTHAVLAGHTGLSYMKIFDNLNKLVEGDEFFIYVMDEELKYKVDNIVVVEPNDTDTIRIEEGKDYVTLVTCTPYLLNTHRLLVRGERILDDNIENTKIEEKLDQTERTVIIKTIKEKVYNLDVYDVQTIIKVIIGILIIILIVLAIRNKINK